MGICSSQSKKSKLVIINTKKLREVRLSDPMRNRLFEFHVSKNMIENCNQSESEPGATTPCDLLSQYQDITEAGAYILKREKLTPCSAQSTHA